MDGEALDAKFQELVNLINLQEATDNMILEATKKASKFAFADNVVKQLHSVAMHKLPHAPGEYRQCEVHINGSPHIPPSWIEVPTHMTSMFQYVNKNWNDRDLIHLSAFVLWRMNWIHPFEEGNGRTTRAVSYLILCIKHGKILPAKNTIVEQIIRERNPYYLLLRTADEIYTKTQNIDQAIFGLEQHMAGMLKKQLLASFEK